MYKRDSTLAQTNTSTLVINSVLRNTYFLLSLTLLFSAFIAYTAMVKHWPSPNIIVLLAGMFGLSYLTTALRNSGWGLVAVFLFTGFMGYTLGPVLDLYLHAFANGKQLILTSLVGTGGIFLALSAYALVTRKDFSYLGGFLFAAMLIAFLAGMGAMLFHAPMVQILVSCAFALISSAYILFQTSLIIHGGERNYIMATISLYASIFNLFVSLLNILSFFAGDRR
jgi:modulator of FtsH protease